MNDNQHHRDLYSTMEELADQYPISAPPFARVERAIRKGRRRRIAITSLGVASVIAIAGGSTLAVSQLGGDSQREDGATPQSARCLSDAILASDPARTTSGPVAAGTREDCTTFRLRLSGESGTTLAAWPSMSGDKVVIVENRDGDSEDRTWITLQDTESGRAERLLERDVMAREAVLSPDGTKLAVVLNAKPEDGYGHLYVLDIASGDLTPVPETHASTGPAWSADGTKLAYVTLTDDKEKTRVMILDAGSNRSIDAGFSPGALEQPAWSPDGRRIAVTARSQEDATGQVTLSIRVRDLTSHEVVTTPATVSDSLGTAPVALGWEGDEITLVAWGSDQRETVSYSLDEGLGTVRSTSTNPAVRRVW